MKTDRIYIYTPLPEVQAQLNERESTINRNKELLDILLTVLAYAALAAGSFICPALIWSMMN